LEGTKHDARWERLKDLFDGAVHLPAEARGGWLRDACGSDTVLRDEVESLLRAHERAGDFLESSPLESAGAAGAVFAETRPPPTAELAGRAIGPYRIVRELARGGMGVVYLGARDDEAFEKRVAIKLVQGGALRPSLLQRFHEERRILAALDHPHIARLLDAGTTEDGLPYVVMEYVEGQAIDAFCRERSLSTRQRLELFCRVCDAVQYSHLRLVVHRDIKPGNILITSDGVPKLLDFGIARMVQPDDPGGAPTLTAFRALTPESASPEQVRGEAVTVASDVYSLGGLLYRLLAERSPYGSLPRSEADMARAICEETPLRPSDVLVEGASGPRVRELRGDLDLIVLKALKKEPERRYASVEQLSQDVQRHLAAEPIQAAPDSWRYRAGKLVRRHPATLAVASVAVLALLGGTAATAWQARKTEAQRQRAEEERVRAERRFQDVRALANSFLFEFHDAIADLPGSTPARELVVRRAAEYLDSLAGEAGGDPRLQHELATAYARLADVQGGGIGSSLGDSKGALTSYGKALALRKSLAANPAATVEEVEALADLHSNVGAWHAKTGTFENAEGSYQAALAQTERLRVLAPATDVRARLAEIAARQSWLRQQHARFPEAIAAAQEAVRLGEEFCRDHPDDIRARGGLAAAYGQLLMLQRRRSEHSHDGPPDPVAALETSRRASALLTSLAAAEPHNARHPRALVPTLVEQGYLLVAAGHPAEGIRVLSRAVEIAETQLAKDPRDAYARTSVALTRHSLGDTLAHHGQRQQGLAAMRRAARELEAVVADDPTNTFAVKRLAGAYYDLGFALASAGAGPVRDEGCRVLQRARALYERVLASDWKVEPDVLEALEEKRAPCVRTAR
jgi:eukaryotic-like serine/threonine-protein kinase